MGWESDSPCGSHTYPGQGRRSSGRHSGWKLEFKDCGAIPGQGLLLTVEWWIEGMWGRKSWWEMPVEESQADTEAGWYCWVTPSRWSHHPGLSLPTHQHRAAEQQRGWPIKCLTHSTTGQDSSQGGSSMCLMSQTTEKDPRQGTF